MFIINLIIKYMFRIEIEFEVFGSFLLIMVKNMVNVRKMVMENFIFFLVFVGIIKMKIFKILIRIIGIIRLIIKY